MADITRCPFLRHLRADADQPTSATCAAARSRHDGTGQAFWFRPLTAALSEVPVDDREQPLLFHARTLDFQDVTVQATVTYRVADPALAATRLDFAIDPEHGRLAGHAAGADRQPADRAGPAARARPARPDAADRGADRGHERRSGSAVAAGAGRATRGWPRPGVEVVGVRVVAVRAEPDVERALQTPTREEVQQEADRATYERRAMAVERERAIAENELQNQIELARREEQLVDAARPERAPAAPTEQAAAGAHRRPRPPPVARSGCWREAEADADAGVVGDGRGRGREGPAGAPTRDAGPGDDPRRWRSRSSPATCRRSARSTSPRTWSPRCWPRSSPAPRPEEARDDPRHRGSSWCTGARSSTSCSPATAPAQAGFFLRTAGPGPRRGGGPARRPSRRRWRRCRAAIPADWRRAQVERDDLARFLFGPEDIVVAVGQDGLVANVAKYLDGQPVIGVNPEPGRNPGVLVPHRAGRGGRAAAGRRATEVATREPRTMVARRARRRPGAAGSQRGLRRAPEPPVGALPAGDGRRARGAAVVARACSSAPAPAPPAGAGRCGAGAGQRACDLPGAGQSGACAGSCGRPGPRPRPARHSPKDSSMEDGALTVTAESDLVVFGDGIECDTLHITWGQSVRLSVAPTRLHLLR